MTARVLGPGWLGWVSVAMLVVGWVGLVVWAYSHWRTGRLEAGWAAEKGLEVDLDSVPWVDRDSELHGLSESPEAAARVWEVEDGG